MHIKKVGRYGSTVVSSGCIKVFSQLVETAAHFFTDILFLDNHIPYFFIKDGLKLLKEKAFEIAIMNLR